MTISELQKLRETEDKVEFKEAHKDFTWNGGSHSEQKDRRKCYLGYLVALANEGGGLLVFGMADKIPHTVVGTDFALGEVGALEDAVYEKLQVRVHCTELFDENGLRVLVTEVPSRPIGKTLKFEGVALMRTGDSLRNMSDDEFYKILSEQEPDFSAKICQNFSLSDIDEKAIEILKSNYSKKQNNPSFLQLSTQQLLSDLGLSTNEGLTYAALITVGKKEALGRILPNASVNIEYRQTLSQTNFDKRDVVLEPIFIGIDMIWKQLDARNRNNIIDEGPYKFDIPYFSEEVIRESVLNAIAHRDYSITSETVIKQYPDRLIITNAGGFPKGVTKENILRINSTPRSRLLTEILEKTGLVERSGQGVDKIYRITLSEGKSEPDYSKTDFYQVELNLSGEVVDKAFAIFITLKQEERSLDKKLGTFEVDALFKIKEGKSSSVDLDVLKSLEQELLIKRVGGSASQKYALSDDYFDILSTEQEIGGFKVIDLEKILNVFKANTTPKMNDFVSIFDEDLNRAQVKYLIEKLTNVLFTKEGSGKGTFYKIIEEANSIEKLKEKLK
jgi:ATP-dependent DNA helicase RecG